MYLRSNRCTGRTWLMAGMLAVTTSACSGRDTELSEKLAAANAAAARAEAAAERAEAAASKLAYKAASVPADPAPAVDDGSSDLAGEPDPAVGTVD